MSCLFDSLSTFVALNPYELRQAICDYLETNPLLMDDLRAENVIELENGNKMIDYIRSMRNQSTMGGAIEIRAFVNIFKINIRVKSLPNQKNIEFVNSNSNNASNNAWREIIWNGGHFDPLIVIS